MHSADQIEQAQRVVDALNDAFFRDPVSVHLTMCHQVQCNQALASHPTVQCGPVPGMHPELGSAAVRPIGYINCIMETLGLPLIGALWTGTLDHEKAAAGEMQFVGFKLLE